MGFGKVPQQQGTGFEPATQSEKDSNYLDDFKNEQSNLLTYGLPLILSGAVDTVGRSVGLLDEGDIQKGIESISTDAGRLYKKNQEGFQLGGEIVSSLAPILKVPKLIQSGKLLDKVIRRLPLGEQIAKFTISSGKNRADRIKALTQELKVFQKSGSVDITSDLNLMKAIRREKLGAAADSIKENVAIDASLYGFLSESELFFPSDQSMTNLALYTIPTGIFGLGAYAFTGQAILRDIASVSGRAVDIAKVINPNDIRTIDGLSRKGTRGNVIAAEAAMQNEARFAKDNATDGKLQENSLGREKVAEDNIKNEITKLGNDKFYGEGIDAKAKITPETGESLTASKAFADEPSLAVGATSLNPVTPKTQLGIEENSLINMTKLEKEIAKLDKKLIGGIDGLSPKAAAEHRKDQVQFDTLVQSRNDLEAMHAGVIETDSSFVPASERRWSVLDEPQAVQVVRTSEGVELAGGVAGKLGQSMGFTNTGKFLQSGVKFSDNEIIHGINATDVIPQTFLSKESLEFAEAGLEGTVVKFTNTTPSGNRFINNNPAMKKDFTKLTTNEVDELAEAFTAAGFQKELREFADSDGLIPLYKTDTNITKSGHRAMDIKPSPAKAGGQVVRTMVHVDDIVGSKNGRMLVKDIEVQAQLKSFQAQNFEQRTTALVLAQKFVDGYKVEEGAANQIIVNEGRTWLELDVAIAVMKKNPDAPVPPVKLSSDVQLSGQPLIEAMEYMSLVKKQMEYSKLKVAQKAITRGILKSKSSKNLSNDYTIATMLNLPNPTGSGIHPIMELFDGLTPQVGGVMPTLRAVADDLPGVKTQMTELVKSGNLNEPRQVIDDYILSGNSLRFDKDPAMKPVVLMSQNRATNRIGPDEVNALLETEKLNLYSKMDVAGEQGAPIADLMFKALRQDVASFDLARKVPLLVQGTQANRGIFTTRAMAIRNSEVLRAQDLIQDVANKGALQYITKEVFAPHTLTFSKLATYGNEGSLYGLNQSIGELRNGWDVAEQAIKLEGSEGAKFGLALEDTQRNKDMYKEFFGRDLTADIKSSGDGIVPMPVRGSTKQGEGIVPTAVSMDELAMEGLNSITNLSHQFLGELNFLRSVKSLPPINKRNFHVPYYPLGDKVRLHITDLQGKTVHVVTGATEKIAREKGEQSVALFKSNAGVQTTLQGEDFTARYVNNAGGDFQAPTINFGFSGRQTGRAKGLSADTQLDIGIDTLQDTIKQLQSNFGRIPRYTSETVFESEINYARSTANSLPGSTTAKETETTVFDDYIKVTGQTASLTEKTGLGKVYYGVEQAADLALAKIWDKYHDFIPSSSRASMNDFEKFNTSVGKEYNPFNSYADFIERTTKTKIPASSRKLLSATNGITTNLVLRIFDPGMPLINFASVAAVSPAVIAASQRGKNEGFDVWKARNGIIGSPISETDILPSTTRMMMSAVHDMFQPEFRAAIKKARTLGLGKQEVAEKIDLITSPMEGYLKRMSTKGIDILSYPTDISEQLSREISFAMFYGIGKRTMKLDEGAAITFAHRRANDVVGDYRASNRPQIFQGATGMPFGLFTTWAWNFGQRVFGDLEGGRMGAVGMQAFIHTVLFGTESLPGYETATNILTQSYDGKTNIVDTLDRAWGADAVDFIGSGMIANIPRIFSDDGIAIGSRASVGIPALLTPGSSIEDMVPSIRTGKTLLDGVAQIASSMRENSGLNGREIAEIISTNCVNGSCKNIAQISLGYAVDKSGQLINSDTRRLPDLLARAFELRTLNESRKIKQMSRDRLYNEQKAAHSRSINKRLRAAMRGGDISDDDLNAIGTSHFKAGGNYQDLVSRIREAAITGQTEISERNLIQAIKRNDDQGRIMRLLRLNDDSTE